VILRSIRVQDFARFATRRWSSMGSPLWWARMGPASQVLRALGISMLPNPRLVVDDYYAADGSNEVAITATFRDFTDRANPNRIVRVEW
jgi:hypothetical protein